MAGTADRCPTLHDERSRSAVVAAEAEGMAGRVEDHPDIVLRLVRSDRSSECDSLGDRRVEVSDLEIEMHHRALLPVARRPHRGPGNTRLLEHDIDSSLRSGEDPRARLLVTDGPS